MDRGLVFNIQRYCLHDGPGIRTTVFLKGCPLSCSWCHNPESQPPRPQVNVLDSRCARCGHCVEACPQGGRAVDHQRLLGCQTLNTDGKGGSNRPETGQTPAEEAARVGNDDCTRCGACVSACPTGARQMVGREMTVREVVTEVLQDRMFHDQSGGGATLSGGEPLTQPAFVLQLCQALQQQGVHTAIDTCGFAPRAVIKEIAPWVNLFLFDIKSLDDEQHMKQTGVSNRVILENLKTLASIHANIWVRVPLVPGFNMDDAQLNATARYVATLSGVQQVNLLPYHAMGTHKADPPSGPAADKLSAESLSTSSVSTDGAADLSTSDGISQTQLDHAANLFRAAGLRTLIGG